MPQTATQAALDRAGEWVLAQFNADGYLPNQWDPSVADLGNGVLAVANLAALDKGTGAAEVRLNRLIDDMEDFIDEGDGDRPGALARVILAVVASGGDPRNVAGADLVARLEATQQPDGRFGAQSATFDGAFRQGLSLAALSLVDPTPATLTPEPGRSVDELPAVSWLRDQQCGDGSWMMFRASTSVDCVENPALGRYKDSNGTALATLGLAAVSASPRVDPAGWFNSVQGSDGGWAVGPSGPAQDSDANSTGLVIAALVALGRTPDASAYDALLAFQLGSGADRGAFRWRLDAPGPNRLATMDAMAALYDEVWPAALLP